MRAGLKINFSWGRVRAFTSIRDEKTVKLLSMLLRPHWSVFAWKRLLLSYLPAFAGLVYCATDVQMI